MADKQREKALRLQRRQWSVRNSLSGTAERPRLSVFRSDKHIYAQVIDDLAGRTLASASSMAADVRGELEERREHRRRQAGR
jgi:large subunit ribosomal protein L18